MYRWFRNNVSLRGIAAIAIGLLFQWAIFAPGVMVPPMPMPLAVVFSLMGLVLAIGGFLAIRFKLHRQRVVATAVARDVMVELEDGGGEGSADTVFVEADGGRWAVPFDGPSAAWRASKNVKGGQGVRTGQMAGRAWFDPATAMPVAVEVHGVMLNTLAEPRRQS